MKPTLFRILLKVTSCKIYSRIKKLIFFLKSIRPGYSKGKIS